MRHTGLFSQGGIFDFDKVAYLHPIAQHTVRTQMAVWSDADSTADHRALNEGGMDLATVADGAVFDDGARSDVTVLSNHHMTF